MVKKIWAWREDDSWKGYHIATSITKPKIKSGWGYYEAKGEENIPQFLERLFKGVKKEPQKFEIEVRKI